MTIINSSNFQRVFITVVAILFVAAPTWLAAQQMSVVDSPHNLSANSQSGIRAVSEEQVCIFCHTPHHASSVRPLWNRRMSTAAYTPYRSNALKAMPGQPTGSSKMCLSCHDGTIALGEVLSRTSPISMSGGTQTMPLGSASNLGTNLSDDHPISFAYDQPLLQKNTKLRNPSGLPSEVKLDENRELQCVSCHNPHDNQFGKFLVMNNTASQLCNACHNQGTTAATSHTNCSSCHQPHTSPSGPYLLRGTTVTATCTASACHGTGAAEPRLNIAGDLSKFSNHDTSSAIDQSNHAPDNTTCTDCHDPHTMGNTNASGAPMISPRLGKIDGISSMGSKVSPAQYEYEVCFKCHGNQATTLVTPISRRIVQTNKMLQFAPSAISFHPVEVAGKNSNVPSLKAGWTTSSIVYCTDCHSSDTSKLAGGSGANGTHGSGSRPMLTATYVTADQTMESASNYALCYRCHNRNNFLNESQPFKYHKKHVVEERTPCSACHDSHGIASSQGTITGNSHLINFDTSIVFPVSSAKPIKFNSVARTCTLTCHGKIHDPMNY